MENKDSYWNLNINVQNIIILNSYKLIIAKMSNKRWMNKQNVVYPYNNIQC